MEPKPVNRFLLVILLAVALSAAITGGVVYALQGKQNADIKTDLQAQVDSLKKQVAALPTATPNPATTTDETATWKSYTSSTQGVSFKYPSDWIVSEDTTSSRIYIYNMSGDYDKSNMPASYQAMWISYDAIEASQARQASIATGKSDHREISGSVTSSTITSGTLNISVYSYVTVGGDAIEAYFSDSTGKRFFATNATERPNAAQTAEVVQLKKILATITFK